MSTEIRHYKRTAPTFDPDKVRVFLDSVRQGHSFLDSCREAGLSKDTVRSWISKGGNPRGKSRRACAPHIRIEPYYTFTRDFIKASDEGKRVEAYASPHGRKPNPIPEDVQEKVLAGIRQGWSYSVACREAGLPLSTFISHLRLGGYPRKVSPYRQIHPKLVREPYKSFVAKVMKAEDTYFAS